MSNGTGSWGAEVRATIRLALPVIVVQVGLMVMGTVDAVILRFLPGVAVGLWASQHTASVLDRGYTRPAVLAVSAGSAIIVIVKQVLS